MKKLILIGILLLGISNSVEAQGIDFGVKIGANFASISDINNTSSRTGIVLGGFAGIKFNDHWGLQADLLYSQQGAEFQLSAIDLDYINLPVILKYYVFRGLHVQFGPQFGIVVDDNLRSALGNAISSNNFDLSGIAGAGYDLPFGIRAEARYNFGLTDVSDNNSASGKNAVITLAIGYSFL